MKGEGGEITGKVHNTVDADFDYGLRTNWQ